MQGITTKYLGPTNTKDGRIKATTASGISKTVPYDDSLEPEQAHRVGADALINQLGWTDYKWIGGSTQEGYAFVQLYPNATK